MCTQVSFETFVTDGTVHWSLVLVVGLNVTTQRILTYKTFKTAWTLEIFGTDVLLFVELEVGSERELHITVRTDVRLVTSVNPSMLNQLTSTSECFVTELTVKRLDSRMDPHVNLETFLYAEGAVTDLADEWSHSRVSSLVSTQAAQLCESGVAFGTTIRSLPSVSTHVFD